MASGTDNGIVGASGEHLPIRACKNKRIEAETCKNCKFLRTQPGQKMRSIQKEDLSAHTRGEFNANKPLPLLQKQSFHSRIRMKILLYVIQSGTGSKKDAGNYIGRSQTKRVGDLPWLKRESWLVRTEFRQKIVTTFQEVRAVAFDEKVEAHVSLILGRVDSTAFGVIGFLPIQKSRLAQRI